MSKPAKLLGVLVLLVGISHLLVHFQYTMDDAYITFRYSANLAGGLGLVHNPGQYVKGYSNTSWTVLMAVPELLGYSPLYFSKAMGLICFVVTFAVMLAYSRASFAEQSLGQTGNSPTKGLAADGDSKGHKVKQAKAPQVAAKPAVADSPGWCWPLFPPLLLSVSAPVAVWYICGMETGFYAAAVLVAVWLRLAEQSKRSPWPMSALVLVLVVWTRPEGIIFFAALAMHDLVYRIRAKRWSLGDLAWYLLPLLAWVAELVWSQAYYGDPLPNTYYAKVRLSEGAGTLLNFAYTELPKQFTAEGYFVKNVIKYAGYGVVALGVLALVRRERRRHNMALLLMVAAQFAFICRVNGDWMHAARFLVPVLPFMFLLLSEGLFVACGWLPVRFIKAAQPIVLVTTVALFIPGNYEGSRRVLRKQPVNASQHLKRGDFFRLLVGPGRSMATFDIGGLGYASGADIIDTAGLTDRFIGRFRWRSGPTCIRYMWFLQPDIYRRHAKGPRRDEEFGKFALAGGHYLSLNEQKVWLRRELVFTQTLPGSAKGLPPVEADSGPGVAAVSLPPAVLAGGLVDATLFWRKASGSSRTVPPLSRQLALAYGGISSAKVTGALEIPAQSIVEQLEDQVVWDAREYLVDRVGFRAPSAEGVYTLVVTLDGGARVHRLAELDVLGPDSAGSRAESLLQEFNALRTTGPLNPRQTERALFVLRTAVALGHVPARAAYVELVIDLSTFLRQQTAQQPGADLKLLNQAKVLVNRAYYHLGRAPTELRVEIDAVEAARKHIIEQFFDPDDLSQEEP